MPGAIPAPRFERLTTDQAEPLDDHFGARSHLPEFLGDQQLFRRGGLFELPLEMLDLLPPMTPPLNFLLSIADSTHV
jgi:hypothetical protein